MEAFSVTLTNPDQMSPTELRAALERAERSLLQLALRHSELRVETYTLCQQLQAMCEASLAGDAPAVLDAAGKIASNYRENMGRDRTERAEGMH